MAKKKRSMPPHIVLPNGMWRFVKKGTKSKRSVKKRMARRRSSSYRVSRRRSSRRSSGGYMKKGIIPVSGIIAGALLGAGAATLQEKFLPQAIPYQGAAAGFAVAGIAGAAGALIRDMLKVNLFGATATSPSVSAYALP